MAPAQGELPESVARALNDFVEAARAALGSDLRSIVLYGSGAEGELRETSDLNVVVVLSDFDAPKIDRLREPLRTAHAAARLEAMFVLDREMSAAAEAFAVKFADIRHRHRVLWGADPFAGIAPSRQAEIARLKQVLMNLVLRLRQKYLMRSLRDEQTAIVLADTAGPLRACAAALLELQGKPAATPKVALASVVADLPGPGWDQLLRSVSDAREHGALPPGVGPPALLRLIELATAMRSQVEALG